MKMKHFFILMLSIVSINFMNAQSVSGSVTDASGNPLTGVNIIEKSTSNGVISDFDGKYMISVSENATLVFSYVGYNTQEVEVNGQRLQLKLHQ